VRPRFRESLATWWRHEREALLDALLPPLCWLCRTRPAVDGLGCGEHTLEGTALDPAEARCSGCLDRLPEGIEAGAGLLCAGCRRGTRGFRRLLVHGAYRAGGDGPGLRGWILAFKHGRRADLARPLGVLLAEVLRREGRPEERACLVPVPLHPLRRLERGHDQAAGLAREVGAALGIEVVRALARIRSTPPQGSAEARSRRANVRGAFRGRGRGLAGRAVTLVDDVVTSGATAAEAAVALRAAGATRVSVLALARVDRGPGRDGSPDRLYTPPA
jgi:ComF family protein